MKNKLYIYAVLLGAIFGCVSVTFAQTTDEKIQAVQAEIEQLKQQKLRALEAARDALKGDVSKIKDGNTNGYAPAPTETPAPAPTTTTDFNTNSPVAVAETILNLSRTLGISHNNNTIQSRCALVNLAPDSFSKYDNTICNAARDLLQVRREQAAEADDATGKEKALRKGLEIGSAQTALVGILTAKMTQSAEQLFDKSVKSFLLDTEAARLDKQPGADSKTAGTTSLAVKGGVPAFLTFAEENGAAEGSITGNTITFRVNPVGLATTLGNWAGSNQLINAASAEGINTLFRRNDDAFVRTLRKTSLGFSFDITRGTDSPLFVGSKQQLSAFSFRYELLNRRDPRDERYAEDWENYRQNELKAFSVNMTQIMRGLVTEKDGLPDQFTSADLQAWLKNTNLALNAVSSPAIGDDISAVEAIRIVLEQEIAKLPIDKLKQDTNMVKALNAFVAEHIKLNDRRAEIMKKVAKGEVATFEYTNYRNINAPDLSNFRTIISKGFGYGADLTFNGSITMYNREPLHVNPQAKVQRIRDFDFTLQVDLPFRSFIKQPTPALESPDAQANTPLFGIPVLTFAGKYQRLQSDVVMPNGLVMPNTRGDIAYGQAKLTIPINFNGLSFKLPFSMTFANRTDLVKEKEVRGNFGFTLDIDPFFNMLKNNLAGGLFK